MSMTTTISSADNCESCILCSSKYNRIRDSFCQCKHCSIPLCFECMKEHHDEVLQNVAQISHEYNELQEFIQLKQMTIVDEIAKFTEDVNRNFDTYINELRETQQKIIEDLEITKHDAQNHMLKIKSDSQTLSIDIQALAKESIVQTAKMNHLSIEIKKIKQQVNMYQLIKTENLIKTKPEFSIKYDYPPTTIEKPYSPVTRINQVCQTDTKESSFKANTENMLQQPFSTEEYPTNQPKQNNDFENEDRGCGIVSNDDNINHLDHLTTSYNVYLMASDGKHVLYTSYYDQEPDLIAYCTMDNNVNDPDINRDWKQSRIRDMIWWDSIDKFICATYDGIYTVDYANKRFKITCVIRGNWSYTRVATNISHIFLWVNAVDTTLNAIEIYSTQFKHTRMIDLTDTRIGTFVGNNASFCVTNNLIASICTRMQNNREVFQVTICDLDMNKLNSIPLGKCSGDIEIRTDGKDRFFITTGRRQFYIIYFNGKKEQFNLDNDGDCIAVLHNRRIAIGNRSTNIELLTY